MNLNLHENTKSIFKSASVPYKLREYSGNYVNPRGPYPIWDIPKKRDTPTHLEKMKWKKNTKINKDAVKDSFEIAWHLNSFGIIHKILFQNPYV